MYVDGFVLPIPTKHVAEYKKMAAKAGKVWMEHGALSYVEAQLDDATSHMMIAFPKLANAKKTETVFFSWITYKSKAHRNAVNKKVMKDPRLANACDDMKFMDPKRMAYGGFKPLVNL